MGRHLELAVAALNGLLGDHLFRTGNGLATDMAFVPDADAPSGRVVVLIHGLMGTEAVWSAREGGGDYGTWLARDLGMSPLYLRYNSGLAIADNGAAFAARLEALVDAHGRSIDELVLLGHSMGGLVARSACHVATVSGHRWLSLVRRAIYVGTPHRGAPLERWGRGLSRLLASIPDPYTRLLAQIGDLRSTGIKDLGDPRHPVPLLPTIKHLLIAGTISRDPAIAAWFGDALVPVPSATDGLATVRAFRDELPEHVKVVPGVGHMSLACHPEVYAHVRAWCAS